MKFTGLTLPSPTLKHQPAAMGDGLLKAQLQHQLEGNTLQSGSTVLQNEKHAPNR